MAISDFLDLMPATITHRAALTRDDYGKVATYGPAVSYRARVSYSNSRRVSRITGDDVITNTVVWIGGVPVLHVDDEITLPDGTTPLLVDWQIISDEKGPHHVKAYFR